MIKLNKEEEPDVLNQNGNDWIDELWRYLERNETIPNTTKFRYRNNEIKAAIKRETNNRCAYCESDVTHVYPGDTEHILPSSKRPELWFSWENLTFVCRNCNTPKSDYYEPSYPLINPFTDEPSDHLVFCGPQIFHRPGDNKGYRTKTRLDLNRVDLFERRMDRLNEIQRSLDLISNEPDGPDKDLLLNDLKKEVTNKQPYSAMARDFLVAQNINL